MSNGRQQFEEREVPKEVVPEMGRLEKKIIEKGKEFKESERTEKVIKQEITALKKEAVSKAPPKKTALRAMKGDTAKIAAIKEEKARVEALLKLASEKGVYYATGVAKKLNDPYLLDIFHDHLVSDFYDSLIKQDKLKAL